MLGIVCFREAAFLISLWSVPKENKKNPLGVVWIFSETARSLEQGTECFSYQMFWLLYILIMTCLLVCSTLCLQSSQWMNSGCFNLSCILQKKLKWLQNIFYLSLIVKTLYLPKMKLLFFLLHGILVYRTDQLDVTNSGKYVGLLLMEWILCTLSNKEDISVPDNC